MRYSYDHYVTKQMMKKYVLIALFMGLGHQLVAQFVDRSFFKAGFHASAALGDASNLANLGLGVDLYQHWGVSKKIDLGLATGVQYFFGLDSTIDIGPTAITTISDDTIYVPVAALFRFYPISTINIGGDLGYALGLNASTEGGFYYRPTVSLNLSSNSALNFSYVGIQGETIAWSTLTAGVLFRF